MSDFVTANEGELRVLRAAASGEIARFSGLAEKDRVIRPSFLRALLQGHIDSLVIDANGVRMAGAVFEETLNLANVRCAYPLAMRRCSFLKAVNLSNASFSAVDLSGSTFERPVYAGGLELAGDFRAERASFRAGLSLADAEIRGVCGLNKAQLAARAQAFALKGVGLLLERAVVDGGVFMRDGFRSTGEVRLLGAIIGGDWSCVGGVFENKDEVAILADRVEVGGSVFMRDGFRSTGAVRLLGATIGGNWECWNATFDGDGASVVADDLHVEGIVWMHGCRMDAMLHLPRAHFGNDWSMVREQAHHGVLLRIFAPGLTVVGDVTFGTPPDPPAGEQKWDFTGATFQSRLTIPAQTLPLVLKLGGASIGMFDVAPPKSDDAKEWELHGIKIDALKNPIQAACPKMLELLDRADGGRFFPQPYRQFFRALREAGHAELAARVGEAMEKHRYRAMRELHQDNGSKVWQSRWWKPALNRGWIKVKEWFHRLSGYGYNAERLLIPALAVWGLGALIYSFVARLGMHLMVPTLDAVFANNPSQPVTWRIEGYPGFSGPIYALDQFLPIVDFGQATMWHPSVEPVNESFNLAGWLLTSLNWFLVASGWVLTTLLVTAVSGVMRRVDADQ